MYILKLINKLKQELDVLEIEIRERLTKINLELDILESEIKKPQDNSNK